MFFDPAMFPFTQRLEAQWRAIAAEFEAVRHDLVDWPHRDLYGGGWKVFGLYDFPGGGAIEANVRRCPVTASIIEEAIPRHGAVGFSVFQPRTCLRPHVGHAGQFLRCHLGLIVPEGDCGIEVNGEARGWAAGKTLVFDDRLRHEAWNGTDRERVLLLVDFIPAG
jgi:aspartyl/asparaginyl beta-hydroxylase (cupin superfamily)